MNPDVLAARYEQECNDEASDINEHLPTLLHLVLERKPKTVVELGVRYGSSTLAWLLGLHKLGEGHLWSVDCSFPIAGPTHTESLLDPQGPLGVVDFWTFILGYDIWPQVQAALPKKTDILFIDTNHVYEETLVELNMYHKRVNKGGVIVLHDTAIEFTGNATTPQPPFPVLTAVKEFCAEKNLWFDNHENCNGLGIIYC